MLQDRYKGTLFEGKKKPEVPNLKKYSYQLFRFNTYNQQNKSTINFSSKDMGCSSSSSNRLGDCHDCLKYDDLSKYSYERGKIEIHGMKIQGGITVIHHGIIFVSPQTEFFICLQWGKQKSDFYLSKKMNNYLCKRFDKEIMFKDLKSAMVSVAFGKDYDPLVFNCNHWTEQILMRLGINQKIRYDCPCAKGQKLKGYSKIVSP